MPAPGKYPDERGRRAIRLTPGRLGRPGSAWGVFAARGRRGWGRAPRPCAAEIRPGFGAVAGDRPGTTTGEARRTGEPASGGPRAGGGGRDRAERVGLSWRRSVSAPATDPPGASTGAREELRGLCRVCRVLTESGCRTGPVHLTHAARSRPPSKRSISEGRFRGREGILALRGGAASTRALGSKKTWRLPGSRQEGPRVARMRRGCGACGRRSPAGAGPGRTVRTTRPAKGNPVPDDLLHRDSRRRPVRTGAGWSTSPAVPTRHGVPRCTAFVTGPVRDGRIVGWATSTRTGHRGAAGALEQATRGAKAPRRR